MANAPAVRSAVAVDCPPGTTHAAYCRCVCGCYAAMYVRRGPKGIEVACPDCRTWQPGRIIANEVKA